MLVAQPYISFDKIRTPRIISEVRKQEVCQPREQIKPRLSGELLVLLGNERRWTPRRVTVRGGQLHLASIPGEPCSSLKIPLRQLSLRAGPLPCSLALIKGQATLLTLQTVNERSFDLWVKTIAIELIRQTPLESIKYLDILNLTNPSSNRKTPRDCNSNYLPVLSADATASAMDPTQATQPPYNHNHNTDPARPSNAVEVILKKCQSTEDYVPVREKLVLFESLCRIGRVCSTEDVSVKGNNVVTKRARSMHDLTYCVPSGGVREMRKYFESKGEGVGGRADGARAKKRFINSDSNLSGVKFSFDGSIAGVSYA